MVLAVGATGVGKSTLMNAVISGSASMDYDEDFNIVATKDLTYNSRPVFTIGHDNISCTATPGFCLSNGVYFVDCPGLQD